MIIPIGLDSDGVRRMPWVTFGIVAACFAVFLWTAYGSPASGARIQKQAEQVLEYFALHPYLELHPELMQRMTDSAGVEAVDALRSALDVLLDLGTGPDPAQIAAEQAELDARTETLLAMLDDRPFDRWGLFPSDLGFRDFLTYMFLHGGWLHLLGNLFILYLVGLLIEDVWGRPLYGAFYVLAGIVAAGAHVLRYPEAAVPLIGASGAIAGVMGAFLIRYWNTRIHFFYIFGIIFRGTFWAPAWLMLPLWLLLQVGNSMFVDWAGIGSEGGIAYWCHIGGFAFGAVFAAGMKKLRIEERYIHPGIESSITTEILSDPDIERALEASANGSGEAAYRELADRHRRDPRNVDVGLACWMVAVDHGWPDRAAPVLLRVVQEELRLGQVEIALEHWRELRTQLPEGPGGIAADAASLVRVARALSESQCEVDAAEALHIALQQPDESIAAVTLLQIADLALPRDPELAAQALDVAERRADLLPEEQVRITELRSRLGGTGDPRSQRLA